MPSKNRVTLPGSHRAPVPGASEVQPVGAQEIIQVTVIVRRRPDGAPPSLDEFGFTGPGAVNYHPREEFAALYGADPADIAAVEDFAREYDLQVLDQSIARRSVLLSGTAANMQKAFGTSLAQYQAPSGPYRGRLGSLTIPADLQNIIVAVLGLDNRPVARTHFRIARAATPSAFTPLQVAQLYNFPTGADGAGETIGIIELGGGFSTSDLSTYFTGLGVKAPTVVAVPVDGGTNSPGVDQGSDGEVMLDIEVAGAIAPAARIVVYFAPNTDQGFVDAISTAVHDTTNKPSVISISWGGPEDSWTQQSAAAMLGACTDAATVGVTVTVAAGDDGASDGETDNQYHVDLPACLPPVLGCGGTRLNTSQGKFSSEVVWNELALNEGATGGGVSRTYALPSYQASAGVPVQPQTKFAGRGVPDVAGNADPETGYQVLVDSQSQVIGGTSAVAPLWAGLIAVLNQQLGKAVGFVQPALYRIGEAAFRDITSGNNGGYNAAPNWDACTGLGSPNGAALLAALRTPAS